MKPDASPRPTCPLCGRRLTLVQSGAIRRWKCNGQDCPTGTVVLRAELFPSPHPEPTLRPSGAVSH
jgi:hypothetical protein